MPFILGAAVLVLLLWAANAFTKADLKLPKKPAQFLAGLGVLALAGLVLLRGEIVVAIPVALLGLVLLDWISMRQLGRWWRSLSPVSRIRTAFLDMEINQRTGAMRGRILVGRYEGKALDAVEQATLVDLLPQIDSDSRELLAAYLDRRAPGWRVYAKADAAAGGRSRPVPRGEMTEEEAYQVLGVEPGTTTDDISRAHRALMKKLHPDQGGSTYLAARVNEAKDVLLRRHR